MKIITLISFLNPFLENKILKQFTVFIFLINGCSNKSTYDAMQFIQKNKNDREITKEGIIPNSERNPNYEEYKDKLKE